mgnify:FL=1|tara:strand:+ start:5869 stop:6189 length:321 start_codon:yes stop_codon:yes gene_type:complete
MDSSPVSNFPRAGISVISAPVTVPGGNTMRKIGRKIETAYGDIRDNPEKEGTYIINLWLDARYEVEEVVVDDSVLEAAWEKPITPKQVVGSHGPAQAVARYIATKL